MLLLRAFDNMKVDVSPKLWAPFLFCPYSKMEAKSSSEVHYFRRFLNPMIANCVHWLPISEREIFVSLKGSKFSVESDWNNKNSQNVQSLGFFGKIHVFFSKKSWFFSKSVHVANFFQNASQILTFLENVLPPYFRGFLRQKSEKK